MKEMTASSWKRRGSSIVWSANLLAPLITQGNITPLREVLSWVDSGLPATPPGDSQTILVGGLQTVLESLGSPEERYQFLRTHILKLCQECGDKWDRVGLVFGMDGPGKMFSLNEADDLVYFGKGSNRENLIAISRGMWNGAATDAFKLMEDDSKTIGGYHVQRVS